MAVLDSLLAASGGESPVGSGPDLAGKLCVVTCCESAAEVALARALRLAPGQVSMVRVPGPVAAGDELKRAVAFAVYLDGCTEVLVVTHTRCGLTDSSSTTVADRIASRGGRREWFGQDLRQAFHLQPSPRQLAADVAATLRTPRLLPEGTLVHAAVLDESHDRLEVLEHGGSRLNADGAAASEDLSVSRSHAGAGANLGAAAPLPSLFGPTHAPGPLSGSSLSAPSPSGSGRSEPDPFGARGPVSLFGASPLASAPGSPLPTLGSPALGAAVVPASPGPLDVAPAAALPTLEARPIGAAGSSMSLFASGASSSAFTSPLQSTGGASAAGTGPVSIFGSGLPAGLGIGMGGLGIGVDGLQLSPARFTSAPPSPGMGLQGGLPNLDGAQFSVGVSGSVPSLDAMARAAMELPKADTGASAVASPAVTFDVAMANVARDSATAAPPPPLPKRSAGDADEPIETLPFEAGGSITTSPSKGATHLPSAPGAGRSQKPSRQRGKQRPDSGSASKPTSSPARQAASAAAASGRPAAEQSAMIPELKPELAQNLEKVREFCRVELTGSARSEVALAISEAAASGAANGDLVRIALRPLLQLGPKRYKVLDELLAVKAAADGLRRDQLLAALRRLFV